MKLPRLSTLWAFAAALALCALLLTPSGRLAYAAGSAGTSGADFLEIGVGSRPLGMGGAFFPLFDIRDDVSRGKYNMVEILDPVSVTYDLVYLKDKRKSRSVRSFVEVFKNFDFHSHPTRGMS